MARSFRPTNEPPFFAEPWPGDPPIEAHYAPTITADPASQAQGMGAQLHTLAGIVDAPPLAPDPLLLHDPGIW